MHVNTSTSCHSKYTVNYTFQEVLVCKQPLEKHAKTLNGELIHKGYRMDQWWTWRESEADK